MAGLLAGGGRRCWGGQHATAARLPGVVKSACPLWGERDMRESQLAGKLTLLVVAFAALFLLFGATTWRTLEQVRVKGPIYTEIVLGKDLIADVLPPPAYIIESYLLTLQLVDEADPNRVSQLV